MLTIDFPAARRASHLSYEAAVESAYAELLTRIVMSKATEGIICMIPDGDLAMRIQAQFTFPIRFIPIDTQFRYHTTEKVAEFPTVLKSMNFESLDECNVFIKQEVEKSMAAICKGSYNYCYVYWSDINVAIYASSILLENNRCAISWKYHEMVTSIKGVMTTLEKNEKIN